MKMNPVRVRNDALSVWKHSERVNYVPKDIAMVMSPGAEKNRRYAQTTVNSGPDPVLRHDGH